MAKIIKQTYEIDADLDQVWEALTDAKVIDDWGGGPAKMKPEVGFEFEVWGGDIFGKNLEVRPKSRLVQEWWGDADWAKPSTATFNLTADDEVTTVELIHEGVPEAEVLDFAAGWRDYYLGPMKEYLELE